MLARAQKMGMSDIGVVDSLPVGLDMLGQLQHVSRCLQHQRNIATWFQSPVHVDQIKSVTGTQPPPRC